MPVEAVLDAYPDWRIPAHVITTIPSADRQKATVKVRIGFEQLDPRILPDMGVKVSFLTRARRRRTRRRRGARLLVPKAAVRTRGRHDRSCSSCTTTASSGARSASATTNGDQVEVLSGVSAGERVVVEGPQTLKDGDKVKVQ